jgi:hypothetical protein
MRFQVGTEEIASDDDVTIDQGNQRCPCSPDPCIAGGAAAAIGGEPHDAHRWCELSEHGRRVIGGSIIHNDDLVGLLRDRLIYQCPQGFFEKVGLIVGWDHYA